MKIENIPTLDLNPYSRNSRTHSDDQLLQVEASIREFGFTNPILVDESNGVIAGHARLMAAKKLEMADVPCIRLSHLTDNQKKAYVIADNKIALNSGWDQELLALELSDLSNSDYDMSLLGFGDDLIDYIDPDLSDENKKDPDEVPSVKKDTISKSGDIWVCGDHKVICGDSTKKTVFKNLMLNETIDICWTDPPYNVDYNSKKAGSIKNDNLKDDEFYKLLLLAFKNAYQFMNPGASIYVAHADTEGLNFRTAFNNAGFKLSGCLIWKKESLVLGRSDYQWIHEPILYGWKPGAAHRWFGGRKQTTVNHFDSNMIEKIDDHHYQISLGDIILTLSGDVKVEETLGSIIFNEKPKKSDDHPTMKPISLIEKQLKNSSRTGDTVLDVFGGSGSTLIAAERLGLKARLVELDPKFVDVIVMRWQNYTGKSAEHFKTGSQFPVATES